MSVNHALRHSTTRRDPAAACGAKKTELVRTFIRLRDQLAVAAATYEAHGIDGANDVLERQWTIENAIRVLAPHVYRDNWTGWLEYDANLMHTPETPSPRCHICT